MNFFQNRPVFTTVLAMTVMLVSTLALAEEKKEPAGKAAVVNGVAISKDDFDREMDFYIKRANQRGQQVPEAQMGLMKNQVLDSLIDRELLFQETKKKGINIDPKDVADELQKIKQRYAKPGEFEQLLNDMGLTESDVQNQIERGLAIQQLIDNEVRSKVTIGDEEVKSYYDANPQLFEQPEQVKASHILVKVDANAPQEEKDKARKKIESVQEKAKKGEDFATLAKTYSEGPSGPNGGDLGYFRRGQMVKPFEDAAFNLNPNETSDIVETQFGYHLIKVVDKKPAQKMTYADVKERLSEHLKKQKMDSEAGAYIQSLRGSAKIEKFL
ncbi:MAG: peptidylprolyl isomerase [Deltaproteobacteria bacterium]|jgi:peptidyl-prolyl cis-trans isomerase C|nr:peptidylprolyl isomerase [Deltaproteobacteria bacterium]